LAFQWRKDGVPLPGGEAAILSLHGVQLTDAGDYSVVVTNRFGAATSAAARLTVRPASPVGVFDLPAFVDTRGGRTAESDAVQAALVHRGFPAFPFEAIATAVNFYDILLFPEQELAELAPALVPEETAALAEFVQRGGVMIVHGGSGDRASGLINRVANLDLTERLANLPYSRTAQAAGTEFADAPDTLPGQSAVTALDAAALPVDAQAIYTNGAWAAVVVLPSGQGRFIFLGWDWFDAAPLGTADGGWSAVLARAMFTGQPATTRPPAIVVQPRNQTAVNGFPASFTVGAVGTPPLQYQWLKGGTDLPGARDATLTIREVHPGDASAYAVRVTNLFGVVTSAVATLAVPEGLLVSVFDDSRYVHTGGGAEAGADAVRAALESLGYWAEPFTELAGAAARRPILQIPTLAGADLAFGLSVPDHVALSNFVAQGGGLILHGSPSSRTTRWLNQLFGFRIRDAFDGGPAAGEFTLQAQSAESEFAGAPPALPSLSHTFTLASSSLPPGTQRLYTRGAEAAVALMGFGAGTILYLGWDWHRAAPLGTADGGWLTVLDRAVRVSAGATNPLPTIVRQPRPQTVPVGGRATFEVAVRGRGPFAYQWRKDGLAVDSAAEAALSIEPVQAEAVGAYDVIVANARGAIQSAPAWLRVFTPGLDLFDDFEPDADLAQWAALGGSPEVNDQGGSVSGAASLWFGGDGPRFATTWPLDTTRGGMIRFHLRLADGPVAPWEAPELPDEGVVLEYSFDAGSTWFPLGAWETDDCRQWTLAQLAIPPPARTPATQFRWRQRAHSGAGFDHWALDEVWINANSIAPRLHITRTNSHVVLTWPADWSGYTLQATDALRPSVWSPLEPLPPVDVRDGLNRLVLPLDATNRFYRLVQW
jgi:hypothetical protein